MGGQACGGSEVLVFGGLKYTIPVSVLKVHYTGDPISGLSWTEEPLILTKNMYVFFN